MRLSIGENTVVINGLKKFMLNAGMAEDLDSQLFSFMVGNELAVSSPNLRKGQGKSVMFHQVHVVCQ